MATGDVFDELPNHFPLEIVETGTDTGHANLAYCVVLAMRLHTFEGRAQRSISGLVMKLLLVTEW